MPNTMPGNTMRGYVVQRIEQMFSDPADNMAALLSDLYTQTDHFETILTTEYGGKQILGLNQPNDDAHLRHLKVDWFGRSGGDPRTWRGRWWRGTNRRGGHQPIDPIVRGSFWTALSLRNAYQATLNTRPPIRLVWVCAGHHFEGHIYPTPQQVTLLLLTPHEGASVERAGLSEAGPFKNNVDNELFVVRREITNSGVQRLVGLQPIPTIGGVAPPGYPRADGSNAVGYYHPYEAADPI